jgi:hypothetical protein
MRNFIDMVQPLCEGSDPAENTITYAPHLISETDPELLRDLSYEGKEWVVIRTSRLGKKAWGFFKTETLAKAACRRYRSRDIVTR